ncbi:DNA-directed RNA polymerase subunit delta [Marinicrinis sediminis]|uniref:Probable DNA-directed RNA polymerase subunit delta n=1 Tax=Marinicrinis sediminis TaxID=1652465 RepID=A0ABW5REP2_9BACL
MSSKYTLKVTPEQAQEMPMVDLAFLILKSANTPFYYRDLMDEVSKIKGISEDQVMDVIAQLYTEINIDGRFACVGNNLWGLKRWYPIDKAEDAVNTNRPRIINDEDDDEEDTDEELYTEEDNDKEYDRSNNDDDDEEESYDMDDEEVDDDLDEEEIEELDEDMMDEEDDDDDDEEDEEDLGEEEDFDDKD